MALVALSVVELRLAAVREVLAGARVTEVALRAGVSRQSVHTWMGRYLSEGVAGLADRSHRPLVPFTERRVWPCNGFDSPAVLAADDPHPDR